MIKSSSNNNSKSSVIGFCQYIATTFHNNLTEAKIANELIKSVQSLNILHLTACATDFSCAVSGFGQSREVNIFVIDFES